MAIEALELVDRTRRITEAEAALRAIRELTACSQTADALTRWRGQDKAATLQMVHVVARIGLGQKAQ